jgi:rSAM/selenodomain-associated transferase 1
MENSAIIIFVKNPELGMVKTRLAKTIGDKGALKIYNRLLQHTRNITHGLAMHKFVFYSDFVEGQDYFDFAHYEKDIQSGDDLGGRMSNAFRRLFELKYDKLVIIGSDCYDLSSDIINEAFDHLDQSDIVIGPALDGGYYLLGMKEYHDFLFENKKWSTPDLMLDTILSIKENKKTYSLLQTLTDIDEEKDLNKDLLSLI